MVRLISIAQPFEDLNRRRDDLRRIVLDVEAKGVRPARAGFDSWMNNLRPMVELFPASLAKSLTATEEFPKGYGGWGQFITRDGGINRRRADMLLTKGRFEFARLAGECPWVEFQKFVEQN